eukprot:TRINITY_DN17045_c0_g1_i1.p1 TRINITY_DN17045_c0_g1~~TRINITY_DN17045_c0_g1_i1.p1  ORF type:complete len:169 (-),score=38.88 TRINITY_DN17045_c0_g1_i1:244-750(-)
MLMPVASPASSDEEVPKVIRGFGKALLQAAEKNDKYKAPAPATCYHWQGTPALCIEEYVLQLYGLCGYSQDAFVLAFTYISNVVGLHPGKISVSKATVHRLALAAVTVAAKCHDHEIRSNEFYAESGNVKVDELDMLEASFFELLSWELKVDDTILNKIRQLLIAAAG